MRPAPQVRRLAAATLAVAYPLLTHAASVFDSRALMLVSIAVLLGAILVRPLLDGRRWALVALVVAGLVVAGLVVAGLANLDAASIILFLPPVLLNAYLAWLFGHTLARRSTPLIERLVRLMQAPGLPLEAGVIGYARNVTRLWTGLFLLLCGTNLVLAVLAAPRGLLEILGVRAPISVRFETWSLFANVLNYAIVAAVFLVEFAYRRRRFPGRPYRNLLDFFRRSASVVPALVATIGKDAGAGTAETVADVSFTVPADHPVFAGHFPGRPVLPAVMLLDIVIEAAASSAGAPIVIAGVSRAKFMAPLAPGDRAQIRLKRLAERLEFEVNRGSERVAKGVLQLRAASHPRG